MKVFVAGSRSVSRLNADVRRRLDNIIDNRLSVVVGDANGVDKAVQSYLHSRHHDLVEVFCAGDECRNNVGGWLVRRVPVPGRRRDFGFYAVKDQAMADAATYGFMIWDGKSVGTLMNVERLVRQGKTIVVYEVPAKRFTDVRSETDWAALVSLCSSGLRRRVERESEAEKRAVERQADRVGVQTDLA